MATLRPSRLRGTGALESPSTRRGAGGPESPSFRRVNSKPKASPTLRIPSIPSLQTKEEGGSNQVTDGASTSEQPRHKEDRWSFGTDIVDSRCLSPRRLQDRLGTDFGLASQRDDQSTSRLSKSETISIENRSQTELKDENAKAKREDYTDDASVSTLGLSVDFDFDKTTPNYDVRKSTAQLVEPEEPVQAKESSESSSDAAVSNQVIGKKKKYDNKYLKPVDEIASLESAPTDEDDDCMLSQADSGDSTCSMTAGVVADGVAPPTEMLVNIDNIAPSSKEAEAAMRMSIWRDNDTLVLSDNPERSKAATAAAAAADILMTGENGSFDSAVDTVTSIMSRGGSTNRRPPKAQTTKRRDEISFRQVRDAMRNFLSHQSVAKKRGECEQEQSEQALEAAFWSKCAIMAATAVMTTRSTNKVQLAQIAAEGVLASCPQRDGAKEEGSDWQTAAANCLEDVAGEVSMAIMAVGGGGDPAASAAASAAAVVLLNQRDSLTCSANEEDSKTEAQVDNTQDNGEAVMEDKARLQEVRRMAEEEKEAEEAAEEAEEVRLAVARAAAQLQTEAEEAAKKRAKAEEVEKTRLAEEKSAAESLSQTPQGGEIKFAMARVAVLIQNAEEKEVEKGLMEGDDADDVAKDEEVVTRSSEGSEDAAEETKGSLYPAVAAATIDAYVVAKDEEVSTRSYGILDDTTEKSEGSLYPAVNAATIATYIDGAKEKKENVEDEVEEKNNEPLADDVPKEAVEETEATLAPAVGYTAVAITAAPSDEADEKSKVEEISGEQTKVMDEMVGGDTEKQAESHAQASGISEFDATIDNDKETNATSSNVSEEAASEEAAEEAEETHASAIAAKTITSVTVNATNVAEAADEGNLEGEIVGRTTEVMDKPIGEETEELAAPIVLEKPEVNAAAEGVVKEINQTSSGLPEEADIAHAVEQSSSHTEAEGVCPPFDADKDDKKGSVSEQMDWDRKMAHYRRALGAKVQDPPSEFNATTDDDKKTNEASSNVPEEAGIEESPRNILPHTEAESSATASEEEPLDNCDSTIADDSFQAGEKIHTVMLLEENKTEESTGGEEDQVEKVLESSAPTVAAAMVAEAIVLGASAGEESKLTVGSSTEAQEETNVVNSTAKEENAVNEPSIDSKEGTSFDSSVDMGALCSLAQVAGLGNAEETKDTIDPPIVKAEADDAAKEEEEIDEPSNDVLEESVAGDKNEMTIGTSAEVTANEDETPQVKIYKDGDIVDNNNVAKDAANKIGVDSPLDEVLPQSNPGFTSTLTSSLAGEERNVSEEHEMESDEKDLEQSDAKLTQEGKAVNEKKSEKLEWLATLEKRKAERDQRASFLQDFEDYISTCSVQVAEKKETAENVQASRSSEERVEEEYGDKAKEIEQTADGDQRSTSNINPVTSRILEIRSRAMAFMNEDKKPLADVSEDTVEETKERLAPVVAAATDRVDEEGKDIKAEAEEKTNADVPKEVVEKTDNSLAPAVVATTITAVTVAETADKGNQEEEIVGRTTEVMGKSIGEETEELAAPIVLEKPKVDAAAEGVVKEINRTSSGLPEEADIVDAVPSPHTEAESYAKASDLSGFWHRLVSGFDATTDDDKETNEASSNVPEEAAIQEAVEETEAILSPAVAATTITAVANAPALVDRATVKGKDEEEVAGPSTEVVDAEGSVVEAAIIDSMTTLFAKKDEEDKAPKEAGAKEGGKMESPEDKDAELKKEDDDEAPQEQDSNAAASAEEIETKDVATGEEIASKEDKESPVTANKDDSEFASEEIELELKRNSVYNADEVLCEVQKVRESEIEGKGVNSLTEDEKALDDEIEDNKAFDDKVECSKTLEEEIEGVVAEAVRIAGGEHKREEVAAAAKVAEEARIAKAAKKAEEEAIDEEAEASQKGTKKLKKGFSIKKILGLKKSQKNPGIKEEYVAPAVVRFHFEG